VIAATADNLRHALDQVGWTRLPWDKE
jgi:hypothetical protein